MLRITSPFFTGANQARLKQLSSPHTTTASSIEIHQPLTSDAFTLSQPRFGASVRGGGQGNDPWNPRNFGTGYPPSDEDDEHIPPNWNPYQGPHGGFESASANPPKSSQPNKKRIVDDQDHPPKKIPRTTAYFRKLVDDPDHPGRKIPYSKARNRRLVDDPAHPGQKVPYSTAYFRKLVDDPDHPGRKTPYSKVRGRKLVDNPAHPGRKIPRNTAHYWEAKTRVTTLETHCQKLTKQIQDQQNENARLKKQRSKLYEEINSDSQLKNHFLNQDSEFTNLMNRLSLSSTRRMSAPPVEHYDEDQEMDYESDCTKDGDYSQKYPGHRKYGGNYYPG